MAEGDERMKQTTEVIGRIPELRRLTQCMAEAQAQLILVYGRRRVGKTYLIHHFFHNQFTFQLTGAYDQPRLIQLRNFAFELKQMTGRRQRVPLDWTEAFQMLREALTDLPAEQKKIIFFDEMPWLDTQRSGFLPAFEWFWNGWGSSQNNLVLIICGSATTWMVEHFAENKGGLFNRQTCRIFLKPFSLHETELFLQARGLDWSRYHIAECYMILGGIPYYLSLLRPELSFHDNIDALFFSRNAELWDEFEHLYRTLFKNSELYISVAQALSEKRGGLSRSEIAQKAGVPLNGNLSKVLNDLEYSGFVRLNPFYGKKTMESRYQLCDYYSLFYFRFLKNRNGKDEHFWRNGLDHSSRYAWAGLTFELLCMDHISQIKNRLGISGVLTEESSWFYKGEENGLSGAQIDLVLDRRDRVINLCEIKYSINEYVVDKQEDASLRNKMEVFRLSTHCKKTLQLTMITTFGIQKNKYSQLITSQVVLDDLFRDFPEYL